MYRAKADSYDKGLGVALDLEYHDIPNEEGWLTGYLVENYMVGPVADVSEEFFMPKWWWPIDPDTVERV